MKIHGPSCERVSEITVLFMVTCGNLKLSRSNLYKADRNTVPMVYLAAVGLVGRSLVMLGGSHLRKGGSHCYNAAPYIVNLGETRSLCSWAGFWNHVTWSSLIDKSR